MAAEEKPQQAQPLFSDAVVEGIRRGDPEAVGAVYAVLGDRLLGYLNARVRDRGVAEDLLESTFLELLANGRSIRGGAAAVKVWLFRAAHFNALDYLRKAQRHREDLTGEMSALAHCDTAPGPEELALAGETTRVVRAAMEQLSDDQRLVLLLRYVGELSARETAVVLGKTSGAIRSLQHRGERSLARILEARADQAAPSDGPWASQG
ncbi:MAG TPA: RNA polymerase sigma factor [Egibacteraceae bacterium]|nr:RNA polymerase sigma factor [Egibacteraceae bacterium]